MFQGDAADFVKGLFKEQIEQDKKSREVINEEARQFMLANPILTSENMKIIFDDPSGAVNIQGPGAAEQQTVSRTGHRRGSSTQSSIDSFKSFTSSSINAPSSLSTAGRSTVSELQTGSRSTTQYVKTPSGFNPLVILFTAAIFITGGVLYVSMTKSGSTGEVSDPVYESSRGQPWSEQFRQSVVGLCKESDEVCGCVVGEIERARILATKFDHKITTTPQFETKLRADMNQFLMSPSGDLIRLECEKKVKREINLKSIF